MPRTRIVRSIAVVPDLYLKILNLRLYRRLGYRSFSEMINDILFEIVSTWEYVETIKPQLKNLRKTEKDVQKTLKERILGKILYSILEQ